MIVCGLFDWKRIYEGFLNPINTERVAITLLSLTLSHFCAYHKQEGGLSLPYVEIFFVVNVFDVTHHLSMVVCFVDIDRIIDLFKLFFHRLVN